MRVGDIVNFESFILAVRQGKIDGHALFSQQGNRTNLQKGDSKVIWDLVDEDDYTFSTTAAIDSISSSNTLDAVDITILGLDENFLPVSQTILLDGQTRVALDTPLLRHNKSFNDSSVDLGGDVYIYENTAITAGKPNDTTKIRGFIDSFDQESLQAVYTVPGEKRAYILGTGANLSRKSEDQNVMKSEITLRVREFGKVFKTGLKVSLYSEGNKIGADRSLTFPSFGPKSDIVMNCTSDTADSGVAGVF